MYICKAGAGQALCEGEAVRVGKTCVLLTLFSICSVWFWTRECTGRLSLWAVFTWNSKWQSAILSHMFPSMTTHREEVCAELLLTDVANPPAKVKIHGTALLLHQLQLHAQSLFQQQALNNPEFQKLLNKLIFVKRIFSVMHWVSLFRGTFRLAALGMKSELQMAGRKGMSAQEHRNAKQIWD